MTLRPTNRVTPRPDTCNRAGRITWDAGKTLWLAAHGAGGLAGIILFPHWDAALVCLLLTGVTICAGHSVGMHRLLIHRSFRTPRAVEYTLVWLGTLVGMAGPLGMMRAHDMRDWHPRQNHCPPHPSHGAGFWRDAWWQLCCEFTLDHPPTFRIEPDVAHSRFYRALEATWRKQQLLLALPLFALGGWAWVLWGICLRVFVSLVGHWAVGHFAHTAGALPNAPAQMTVQGYNLPGLGLLTCGENWHGNHHTFPTSAQLGFEAGQADPGFVLVRTLERLGLASDVIVPSFASPEI